MEESNLCGPIYTLRWWPDTLRSLRMLKRSHTASNITCISHWKNFCEKSQGKISGSLAIPFLSIWLTNTYICKRNIQGCLWWQWEAETMWKSTGKCLKCRVSLWCNMQELCMCTGKWEKLILSSPPNWISAPYTPGGARAAQQCREALPLPSVWTQSCGRAELEWGLRH